MLKHPSLQRSLKEPDTKVLLFCNGHNATARALAAVAEANTLLGEVQGNPNRIQVCSIARSPATTRGRRPLPTAPTPPAAAHCTPIPPCPCARCPL